MNILPIILLLAVSNSAQGRPAEPMRQNRGQPQAQVQELETPTPEEMREHMSTVAKKAQELIENRGEGEPRGIGREISKFAREQTQIQERIKNQYQRIEKRSGIAKWLLGADEEAVAELKDTVKENRNRLGELRDLKETVESSEEVQEIEEMVEALETENSSLEQTVAIEQRARGVWGFVRSFFQK